MRHRRSRMVALLVTVLVFGVAASAAAQTSYFNLDGGRPARVEDAEPTARYSLAIDLAPVTWEHLSAGTNRFRTEPRVTYGILPFTDIEARVPIVGVVPPHGSGARSVVGAAGLNLGMLHQFNLETPALPALGVAGEVALPVGSLAPPSASYIAKLLLTRTTAFGRVHLNAGGGRYAVRTAASSDSSCTISAFIPRTIPRAGQPCASGPPIIVDLPCTIAPAPIAASATRMCMQNVEPSVSAATTTTPRSTGGRWFGGIGFDHALGLRSTVVIADLLAERFEGLYAKTDWTAEVGARQQLTPLIVADEGFGWRFAGTFPSFMLTLGASYEVPLPPLGRR